MRQERKNEVIANKLMINFLLSILFGAVLIFLMRGFGHVSAASITRNIVIGMSATGFVGMVFFWFYIRKHKTYVRWDGTFAALAVGSLLLVYPGVNTKKMCYVLFAAIPVYWVLTIVYYTLIFERLKKWKRKSQIKSAKKQAGE